MMLIKRAAPRLLCATGVLVFLGSLASCPSEPYIEADQAVEPSVRSGEVEAAGSEAESSILDEVDVMGSDEAREAAERDIDDSNVLEALEQLEKEIGGN